MQNKLDNIKKNIQELQIKKAIAQHEIDLFEEEFKNKISFNSLTEYRNNLEAELKETQNKIEKLEEKLGILSNR